MREPVRFHAGLACLLDGNDHVLLEVGPGRVLVGHALQHLSRAKTTAVIPSSRHVDDPVDDAVQMLDALGRLWAAGAPVDLDCLHAGTARLRVPLPTYRFDHVRHWIEPGRGAAVAEVGDPQQRRNDIADWFYCPSWIKTQPAPDADSCHTTLIFADRCKLEPVWQRPPACAATRSSWRTPVAASRVLTMTNIAFAAMCPRITPA
ncbi:hypothetical protein QP162_08905 [Sphingomonas aurantiaca]|uniref:hypothetical protein n=1 Tax=Sphingomonas aurantiaca TaxID=185949 RepID=UPI002FE16BE0